MREGTILWLARGVQDIDLVGECVTTVQGSSSMAQVGRPTLGGSVHQQTTPRLTRGRSRGERNTLDNSRRIQMAVQVVRRRLLRHRMVILVKHGDFRGYGSSAGRRKRVDGGCDNVWGTLDWKFQILAAFADSSWWILEAPQQPLT